MRHQLLCVTLIGAALLVSACTPTCKGDSCSRPQSTDAQGAMVIWHALPTPPGNLDRALSRMLSLAGLSVLDPGFSH